MSCSQCNQKRYEDLNNINGLESLSYNEFDIYSLQDPCYTLTVVATVVPTKCTIQSYGYIINGSHVNDPCSANIGDKIEAEVDAQFDSSEIGKVVQAMVGIGLPNGSSYAYDTQQILIRDTTVQTFIVNLTPYFVVGGLYDIGSVFISDVQTGTTLCSSRAPTWCHSLTLKAPVLVPCTITAGYFINNGSPISGASCEALQSDNISADVDATFSGGDIGQKYGASVQIKGPDGSVTTIASLYMVATSTTKFIFGNWSTPIPVGTYTLSNILISDIYGNTFCGPTNQSGGNCQSITIKASPVTLGSISISPSSVTIGTNGTTQLTAVCKDQTGAVMNCQTAQFHWSSDNNSIATIDGLTGLITGVSAGTANITLKIGVGNIVSNKAVITVSPAAPSLTTITITPVSATIGANGTSQLTAVCKDQTGKVMICPELIWNSDDIYVATVTEFTGLVTGSIAGTANITAQSGGITSNQAVITVSAAAPTLTTITISPISAAIGIGSHQNLKAVCKDQTGKVMICPSLIWKTNNSSIAVVNDLGIVTGQSVGTAIITAQSGTIISNITTITVSTGTPPPVGGGSLLAIGGLALGAIFIMGRIETVVEKKKA